MQTIKIKLLKPTTVTIVELVLILFIITSAFFPKMITTPFHIDESYWISTSFYFEDWITLNTDSSAWQINYGTVASPNLPKYLIAIGRIIGEYDLDIENMYDITKSYEENVAMNRVPSPVLLYLARIPFTILSILMCCGIYIILTKEINRLTGVSTILLIISNNTLLRLLVRAMGETPILFFSLLSVYFFYKGLKVFTNADNLPDKSIMKTYYIDLLLCGVFLGLAGSSKIHAPLLIFPFLVLLVYMLFSLKERLDKNEKFKILIRSFSVIAFSAFLCFTLIHPYAYQNPILAMAYMLKFRVMDMGIQVDAYPAFSQQTYWERWHNIIRWLFSEWASIDLLVLNLLIGISGIAAFIIEIVQLLNAKIKINYLQMMLLVFSIMTIAAFLSPLEYPRYFLFPIFIMIFIYTKGFTVICEKIMNIRNLTLSQNLSDDTRGNL